MVCVSPHRWYRVFGKGTAQANRGRMKTLQALDKCLGIELLLVAGVTEILGILGDVIPKVFDVS